MSKLKTILVFTAGLICGGAGAYIAAKSQYERILKDEIDSVKETYKNRQPLVVKEVEEEHDEDTIEDAIEENNDEAQVTEQDKKDYNSILKESGYVNYTKYMNGEEENKETMVYDKNDIPYVIEPEEFGEDGFDTQTLTYYADGVLVDDLDDVVEDPDVVVGLENLKVFEEFGASSVLVRNDIFKVDYEIIKDDWNYSDLNQDVPPQEELTEFYRAIEKERKPHEL